MMMMMMMMMTMTVGMVMMVSLRAGEVRHTFEPKIEQLGMLECKVTNVTTI